MLDVSDRGKLTLLYTVSLVIVCSGMFVVCSALVYLFFLTDRISSITLTKFLCFPGRGKLVATDCQLPQ